MGGNYYEKSYYKNVINIMCRFNDCKFQLEKVYMQLAIVIQNNK